MSETLADSAYCKTADSRADRKLAMSDFLTGNLDDDFTKSLTALKTTNNSDSEKTPAVANIMKGFEIFDCDASIADSGERSRMADQPDYGEKIIKEDFSKYWTPDARIMAIGEDWDDHTSTVPKEEMRRHFKELKEGNPATTHMAFEMIPEEWGRTQALKDTDPEAYKVEREKLVAEMISAAPLSDPKATLEEKRANVERYVQMVEAAHDAGLTVVGLEKHHIDLQTIVESVTKAATSSPEGKSAFDEYAGSGDVDRFSPEGKEFRSHLFNALSNDLPDKKKQELADKIMQHLDTMKDTGLNFKKLINSSAKEFESTFAVESQVGWRNRHWAQAVDKVLSADSNSRVAMFGGKGHFEYDTFKPDAADLLKDDVFTKQPLVEKHGMVYVPLRKP